MVNSNILEIAIHANLKIIADNKNVEIKHKLRLSDKSTWGILFFLCGGVLLIIATFIKTSNTTTKISGIVIGLLLVALSIMTLIRQFTDGLKIKDNTFSFRYNLKKTTLPLSRSMEIKMRTEIIKIKRVGTIGTDFIVVTHFIQDLNNEIIVLKFQMDNLYAEKARKLGNEITRIINEKFRL